MDKMEREVLANLETQSKIINTTFKEMSVCVKAYLEENEDMERTIAKIRKNEQKSNQIRKKNLEIVGMGVSIYRSDYLRLVMKMAEVMAHQAGAAVRLGNIKYRPRNDDAMVPKFMTLIEAFLEMGKELRNLIRLVGENMEKAQEQCGKLDAIEEKVDGIYRDLHGHLYNRDDIPLRYIMQLLSVAKHIEEACDHAASVADSIRLIASH